MEHWRIIFLLILIRRAYQQTLADGANEPMVDNCALINVITDAFCERPSESRRMYFGTWLSLVTSYYYLLATHRRSELKLNKAKYSPTYFPIFPSCIQNIVKAVTPK